MSRTINEDVVASIQADLREIRNDVRHLEGRMNLVTGLLVAVALLVLGTYFK